MNISTFILDSAHINIEGEISEETFTERSCRQEYVFSFHSIIRIDILRDTLQLKCRNISQMRTTNHGTDNLQVLGV